MKLLLFFLSLFFGFFGQAQKEDYVWMLGGGSNVLDTLYTLSAVNFNGGQASFSNTYQQYPEMGSPTNASIADENGNLICYTDGVRIYNANYEIIENGADLHSPTSFPLGFTAVQGGGLLPFPKNVGKYILLSCNKINFYHDGWLTPVVIQLPIPS